MRQKVETIKASNATIGSIIYEPSDPDVYYEVIGEIKDGWVPVKEVDTSKEFVLHSETRIIVLS